MSNIFIALEVLIFFNLMYSISSYLKLMFYILIMFFFSSIYLFSSNNHQFDYYSLSDLKFIILFTPMIFNLIDYEKLNKFIKPSIFIQLFISLTLLYDYYIYDFTGTAYKFAVVSNLFIICYFKRYLILKYISLLISYLIIHKWLVFYYWFTYSSLKSKNYMKKITSLIFIIVIFIVSININFNSFESFIYGRVLGISENNNIIIKDGDRFVIWSYYLSNLNFIDYPNYGFRYTDYFGNPVHHHNIYIYLISIYSIFIGSILLYFVTILLFKFYKYNLLIFLHLSLILLTSTVWSNALYLIGLYNILGILRCNNKFEISTDVKH